MPLLNAHVFASHIGHTGKTTLCFQVACHQAARHPDSSVLVLDLAEEGDATKRLLGGVDAAGEKIEELFGSVFRLLSDAQRRGGGGGLTGWLWDADLDIAKYAVRVADHNPHVPPNVFLVSSGAWPRDEDPLSEDARKRVCAKITSSLQKSDAAWRLLCDTDGDRRPSAFTMIGYGLCPHAIVPLHLNKADMDRTETMLGLLSEYRAQGKVTTQVRLVVWNFVKVLKDEPCTYKGLDLPFTPTKVSLDILDSCNKRLVATSKDLPGVFVHHELDDAAFLQSSTMVLRQLADNVLKPSEELGQPFVEMARSLEASGKKSIKFQSGDVEYATTATVVTGANEALLELEGKFSSMQISARVPRGGA